MCPAAVEMTTWRARALAGLGDGGQGWLWLFLFCSLRGARDGRGSGERRQRRGRRLQRKVREDAKMNAGRYVAPALACLPRLAGRKVRCSGGTCHGAVWCYGTYTRRSDTPRPVGHQQGPAFGAKAVWREHGNSRHAAYVTGGSATGPDGWLAISLLWWRCALAVFALAAMPDWAKATRRTRQPQASCPGALVCCGCSLPTFCPVGIGIMRMHRVSLADADLVVFLERG